VRMLVGVDLILAGRKQDSGQTFDHISSSLRSVLTPQQILRHSPSLPRHGTKTEQNVPMG